jgi:hypothetical protein
MALGCKSPNEVRFVGPLVELRTLGRRPFFVGWHRDCNQSAVELLAWNAPWSLAVNVSAMATYAKRLLRSIGTTSTAMMNAAII